MFSDKVKLNYCKNPTRVISTPITLIKADSLIRTNPLLFQPPKKSATIRTTLVSASSACHSEQHQKNNSINLYWCNWHADNADFQTLIKTDSLIRTNPLLFQQPKKYATIRATFVSLSSACYSEQHQ